MKAVHHRRTLVLGALGVVAVALAIGFLLDWKGFAGNALAELAGIVASVLVALFFVDRFTKAERDARWASVAGATARTLEGAAVRASLRAFVQLPTPRPPHLDPRMAETVGRLPHALVALAAALKEAGQTPLTTPPNDLREFVDAVRPSVRTITDVVLPRLLSLDVEPALVELIVELEGVFGELEYDAWMQQTMEMPSSAFYNDASRLVEALGQIMAVQQPSLANRVGRESVSNAAVSS